MNNGDLNPDNLNQSVNEKKMSFSNSIENLKSRTVEVNEYDDPEILQCRQYLKEFRAEMRQYKANGDLTSFNLIKTTLIDWCTQMLKAVEVLESLAISANSKVIAYRVKADIYRYQAELYEDDGAAYTQCIQDALVTYSSATQMAIDLPVENVNRMGTVLNYTVLLSDEMREIDRSISILKNYIGLLDEHKKQKGVEFEEYTKLCYDYMVDNLKYYEDNRDLYIEEKFKPKSS